MAATDRVGIEIELMGYDQAMKQMQNLDGMIKGLSGRKGYLKLKAELDKVEMNKRALKANKVKLKADMSDVEKAIKRTKAELDKVMSKEPPYMSAFSKLPSQANRLRRELEGLGKQKVGIADELQRTNAEIQQSISYAERLRAALRNAGNSGKSLGQIFKGMSSGIAHAGSAMQSMGNAISRLMTPLRMMGTGALMGAGYKALNLATEGLSSGFSRYDTMKKYPRVMKAMGYSSKQAEASVSKLDKAVQGLPTGLDEMVQMAQRYTLTLGDIDKGTNLAIAANNAFLASMSTDTQKYQGMMQLQDLMTGKKLRNTEWTSLINSMSAGINEVGKELGYADDEMDKFKRDLLANKIAPKQFLDALEKVGTGTGKLAELANQSKDTWEAFTSRIGTAFSRMTYGMLQGMDKIVKIATGGEFKSLNSFLDNMIIPGIDNLAKSAQKWIKSHPDEIIGFFNDLKAIDWKGLGTGIVQGVGELIKGVQGIAKWIGGHNLEGIGKWIVRLNVLGQGLLVFGGILKGARHIFAGIGTGLVGFGRILGGLGLAGASEKLLGFVNFFKNFGKVAGAAEAASGVAGAGGGLAAGAIFKGFIPAIEALAGVGAILTMASGIAALDTKLLSMAVDNMIKITSGMHDVFQNVKDLKADSFDGSALKNAVEQMFSMWEIFSGTGETVDAHMAKRGGGRSIAQMDKGLLKDMADSMTSMSSIIGSMSQMQVNMKNLKGFKGFDEKMTQGITNFATALGGIYSAFDEAFGGEGVFNKGAISPEQAEGYAGIIESAESMFKSLNEITNVIPKLFGGLGNITKAPNGGMGKSPFAMVKEMLVGEDTTGGMFKDLGDIFQKLKDNFQKIDTGDLSTKMESALSAFQYIKRIGNQLAKMDASGNFAEGSVDGILAQIKTFINKLSTALDTDLIGDINFKIGSLQQSIDSIFIGLNNAVKNKEVTVSIKGDVTGDDKLVQDITAARTRIENAVKNIPSTINKPVSININPSVNIGSFHIPSIFGNTGGFIDGKHDHPIYRSKGGGVGIFKPKGKDVIPAMLAKGEYVMQKPAVDTFGVRFMQRINNMDIRGAMRELSARAGHVANVNRGNTYNITNNSSPTINQTVNTNNPNFAYKRSNRYVTAL